MRQLLAAGRISGRPYLWSEDPRLRNREESLEPIPLLDLLNSPSPQ